MVSAIDILVKEWKKAPRKLIKTVLVQKFNLFWKKTENLSRTESLSYFFQVAGSSHRISMSGPGTLVRIS